MQKIIKNGLFNIKNRLKRIDRSYYLVFNTSSNMFEVHSKKQKNTYCFSFSYCDFRLIEYAKKTSVKHFSAFMQEITLNNEQIELNSKKEQYDMIKYKALNLMNYFSNSTKNANFF